jgi:beta-lactamase regulating signal transducer with metallopeptidase domain
MNAFWEIVASNAVVATILAIVATLVGRIWRNAAAVHLLWVVVLLKLFTPPLITTELPFALEVARPASGAHRAETPTHAPERDEARPTAPVASVVPRAVIDARRPRRAFGNPGTGSAGHEPWSLSTALAAIWICGAFGLAAGYAVRIRRFAALIRDSEAAPPAIRMMVRHLSIRLGLRRVPDVLMTSRALPPLVWSFGLSPRVILPSELFARLDREAQGTILSHELIHIRRGDHLVRLLELAANTVFWWHPVVWWASRQLRELEEQCCDARVLELLPDQPRTYASALVDTLEFLSGRLCTPVPLPTAIVSTGSLSRRILMLTRTRTNRLTALSASLVVGLVTLPLAVAFAVDPEQAAKPTPKEQQPAAAGAGAAILRGRVTDEANAPLADVRVRVAIPAADMRFVDAITDLKFIDADTVHKFLEARSDASGNYRLEIPGITGRTKISIDAMKPSYRRLVGTLMAGGDVKDVEVAPGASAEASLILKPALYFRGIVVDEQGKPIPAVEVSANAVLGAGSGGVERAASRADGTFELFNYPRKTDDLGKALGKGPVYFSHPDYIAYTLDDTYALAPGKRESLRIVLGTGRKVTGTVFDVAGKPVPDAMVEAVRKDGNYRKATMTDASGKFALRGLTEGLTMLTAHALDIRQKLNLPLALNGDKLDLELRLRPIPLPTGLKAHEVLGMQLTDVTPELKSAYDLWNDRGALILDPGNDSDRLEIGKLVEGYTFWMVGQQRVGSAREFVDRLLAETAGQNAEVYSVRVVYSFRTVDFVGTNTQYLKLTKDDRKQLQIVSDRLTPDEP